MMGGLPTDNQIMLKKLPILRNPALMRLFGYLPPYKWTIVAAMIAMLVSGGSSSLIALVLGRLTDMGFHEHNPDAVWWAPAALVLITILYGGSQYLSQFWLVRVSQSVLKEIRMVMFDRVLRWREETVSQYRVGQVQAKFINEASNALGGAAATLTTIIRESAQVVGLIAVLFWHNWQLSIVTFLIAPMLALVLRWTNKKIKGFTHRLQKMFGVLVGNIQEAYLGERVVKIYGGHEYEVERFADVNEQLRELNLKSQQVNAASTPLTQLITMAGVAVVVVVALLQAQAGELTIGEFTTFLAALLLLQSPIKRLSSLNGTTAAMTAAAESLFTFIDMPVEEDPGNKELPHPVKGEVVFKDVCLQYPTAKKMALKNFNLTVKPGEVIALVGSSGSGKTSVINLLPHFWTATSGDITIDGVSINEVTLSSLRKNMALVSQDVVIFDGTIRDNIAYGCRDTATDEEILRAVEAAALTDFVKGLPDGLDTQVGAQGNALSGGQRQRISIARAFLKDAPIVLLDEATSALDTESEKHVQVSLDRLMKGRTTFVVAHRLTTIQHADRIVVMKNGEIVETGDHEELLAKKGAYEHLYTLQFSDVRQDHHNKPHAPEEE